MSPKQYRQAVAVLVLRPAGVCSPDGCDVYEMLLVHKPRKRDDWQLPQGGIEEGETIAQAGVREVQEETGLTIDRVLFVSDQTYTYDFPVSFLKKHKPINSGQTLAFMSAYVERSAIVKVDQDEIDNAVWILPERLPRYIKRQVYVTMINALYAQATDLLLRS